VSEYSDEVEAHAEENQGETKKGKHLSLFCPPQGSRVYGVFSMSKTGVRKKKKKRFSLGG